MTRLNLVLLLAVLASALYLVNIQYESRRLFTALDRANSQAQKLAQDNERLQVEKRTQATPGRVEQLARAKLQMRPASPAITQYVTYKAAAAGERSEGEARASSAPLGGSAVHAGTSVGAGERSEGPPRASSAPSGGSVVHAGTSVGAGETASGVAR